MDERAAAALRYVSRELGVREEDIKGRTKARDVQRARGVWCWLLSRHYGLSQTRIAIEIGRDRSTVSGLLSLARRRVQSDPVMHDIVSRYTAAHQAASSGAPLVSDLRAVQDAAARVSRAIARVEVRQTLPELLLALSELHVANGALQDALGRVLLPEGVLPSAVAEALTRARAAAS